MLGLGHATTTAFGPVCPAEPRQTLASRARAVTFASSNHPQNQILDSPTGRSSRRAIDRALQSDGRPQPLTHRQAESEDGRGGIGVIGGGVSGIYAALALVELGYTNVTLIEREMRVGGKAAAFEYQGQKYPLGAVATPLALKESSFTGARILERPLTFARNVASHSATKLQLLDANHLLSDAHLTPVSRPRRFKRHELGGVADAEWRAAFGASGPPERFYPHRIEFSSPAAARLGTAAGQHVGTWGPPHSTWPTIYVSAHGYGVAEAAETPPYYYWARFAQKSTNAAVLNGVVGPALRGWDTTSLLERKLADAGVHVRTGAAVASISRDLDGVGVRTAAGAAFRFEQIVLATDLPASLSFLDADAEERELFSSIRHLPYYTVASTIDLPWLKTHSVYYIGGHQGRPAPDAATATAGCPLILLRANRGSNLTISWAYGGNGIDEPAIEACLRRTVTRLGGRFGGVAFIKRWADYFPYVGAETLRDGFHRRLHARQGARRMHMVGEVFNLPLVSECIDFARYLMRERFGRKPRAMGAAPLPRMAAEFARGA